MPKKRGRLNVRLPQADISNLRAAAERLEKIVREKRSRSPILLDSLRRHANPSIPNGPEQSPLEDSGMSEQNKEIARRGYNAVMEGVRTGNLDGLDEFASEDLRDHNPDPGQGPGREGVKEWFSQMGRAFPDMQIHIEDMIAENDRVVTRARFSGTHSGEFQGIPPTQKRISIDVIDIFRIQDGKIVERWGLSDQTAFMQQLGIAPEGPPESAVAQQ